MRVLLVGGTSSLAQTLIPLLRERCELLTAGRKGCDVELDLCSRDIQIPDGIDCVVNLAAAFGGKEPTDILQTMDVNVLGVMKLCHASSKAGAKHLVHISSIFRISGARLPSSALTHSQRGIRKTSRSFAAGNSTCRSRS